MCVSFLVTVSFKVSRCQQRWFFLLQLVFTKIKLCKTLRVVLVVSLFICRFWGRHSLSLSCLLYTGLQTSATTPGGTVAHSHVWWRMWRLEALKSSWPWLAGFLLTCASVESRAIVLNMWVVTSFVGGCRVTLLWGSLKAIRKHRHFTSQFLTVCLQSACGSCRLCKCTSYAWFVLRWIIGKLSCEKDWAAIIHGTALL